MELRPYQQQAYDAILQEWEDGAQNVLLHLATGGGKTVLFSHVIREHKGPAIAIAHRVELVSQISLTLARHGIRHNIIAQRKSIQEIVHLHIQELGRSYYDPHASRYVAGVDTLIRLPSDTAWFKTITLVIQDEAHHVLKENKWGEASRLFPNAKGLYPTATPCRADGKGLGRSADGIIDTMVSGVSMRELIQSGYLTSYRIFAPPSDVDLSQVKVTAAGDYSPKKLRQAVHSSSITGDIVSHYQQFAAGKLGVTFAVDIESAEEIANAFKNQGISAEVISSKTNDLRRASIMRDFRNRKILQLVNVDILGEGVDVPAIEVVSFARPTQSYALFCQQFGRALRPLPGKKHAIIIDHVGNVVRHGLPDAPRKWTLKRRDKRSVGKREVNMLRTCGNIRCFAVYARSLKACPHCGHAYEPIARSKPEHVDGDLLEMSPELLAELRGEVDKINQPPTISPYLDPVIQMRLGKVDRQNKEAQITLRHEMAALCGFYREIFKYNDSRIYREFYLTFGIDVLSAQALKATRALELTEQIKKRYIELCEEHFVTPY